MADSESEDLGTAAVPFSRFHKLSLLCAVSRHKRTVAVVWLLISAVTTVVVMRLPSIYRAEALVLVDSQKIPESFVSPAISGELPDRLALISEHIMTSDKLLDTIHALHLYPLERQHFTQDELLLKMRGDISVSFEKSWTGGRMQAFRLSYEGPGSQLATDVANRLAGLYVAENARSREVQAEDTVDFLSRQLREAKVSLDAQESKVAQFKQDHNGSLPQQESSLLATINSLSVELQGAQAAIARAQESELSLQSARTSAEASDTSLRASLGSGFSGSRQHLPESVQSLQERSALLEEKSSALRAIYTPEHPSVQAVDRELNQVKRERADLVHPLAPSSNGSAAAPPAAELAPGIVQSTERLALLQSQIDIGKHQIASLENQRTHTIAAITAAEAHMQSLPLVEQEMASLKRDYEQSASTYNSLLQKKLAAGIATDMERSQKSERFAVIDPARAPQTPIKPKRALILIGANFLGVLVGLALALVLEFRRDKFLGEWELPSDLVILGRIPASPPPHLV